MSAPIPTCNREGDPRFPEDRWGDIESTDKDARGEGVDSGHGTGNSDTDEWKAIDTDLFDYGQIKFDYDDKFEGLDGEFQSVIKPATAAEKHVTMDCGIC
jgi:hypothetical protein